MITIIITMYSIYFYQDEYIITGYLSIYNYIKLTVQNYLYCAAKSTKSNRKLLYIHRKRNTLELYQQDACIYLKD